MANSGKSKQNNSNDFPAILICALSFCTLLFMLIYKYLHFGYYDWDLAFFSQAMWNLMHGSQYASLVGINFFGDHSYFIMFLILPIYYIFPHPLTLVILKLLSYVLAGFILYKVFHKEVGRNIALAFMFLYFVFPANLFSLLYEFNTEGLAPPLVFAMFYYFKEKRLKPYLAFAFLVFLIKENMALLILMHSIAALFDKGRNKFSWGIIPAAITLAVLYVLIIYIIPHHRGLEHHPFVVRYSHLGNSVGEILKTLLMQPFNTVKLIFSPVNISFIHELFGPLLIPSLISPWPLILTLPILLQHFLSSQMPEHTIFYHYGAILAPFIFLSVANTLKLIIARFKAHTARFIIIILFILCIAQTLSYGNIYAQKIDYHRDNLAAQRWQLVKQIPKNAAVIASFDFLAELSTRKELYSFHKIYSDYYQVQEKMRHSELYVGKAFELPDNVSFALIDLNDPWLSDYLQKDFMNVRFRVDRFLNENNWEIADRAGKIMLLKRNR